MVGTIIVPVVVNAKVPANELLVQATCMPGGAIRSERARKLNALAVVIVLLFWDRPPRRVC